MWGLSTLIEQSQWGKNVQKCWKKKANWSSNQGPPHLAPYALATQPLPPLLLTVLYFCLINGFLSLIRPIVDIVKIIDLCLRNILEDSMSALLEV